MSATKYYPAYLLNEREYDSPESCLDARGCTEEQARGLIALAEMHQSDIVVHTSDTPPHDYFIVIAEDDGKWRTWAARSNTISDTREQAIELMESFDQDVEWRVFDLPEARLPH
jgi:hypothetical protein